MCAKRGAAALASLRSDVSALSRKNVQNQSLFIFVFVFCWFDGQFPNLPYWGGKKLNMLKDLF